MRVDRQHRGGGRRLWRARGLPVRCLVPAGTPAAKLAQARAAGARVVLVAAPTATPTRWRPARPSASGWANLTSTYVNPYMLEGDKTLGPRAVGAARRPDAGLGRRPGRRRAAARRGRQGVGRAGRAPRPAADGRAGERLRADRAGLRGAGRARRPSGRARRARPPPRSPTRCAATRRTARARCAVIRRSGGAGDRRVGGADRRRRGPPGPAGGRARRARGRRGARRLRAGARAGPRVPRPTSP